MNAELAANEEERIIIPIAYRTDYISALKAISQKGLTEPVIRMLDVAQRYTHSVDWSTLDQARAALNATNAFSDNENAKLKVPPV